MIFLYMERSKQKLNKLLSAMTLVFK